MKMIQMSFINHQFKNIIIYGLSALHVAALVNDANMIDILVQHNANVNIIGGEGILFIFFFTKLLFILPRYTDALMLFIVFLSMALM